MRGSMGTGRRTRVREGDERAGARMRSGTSGRLQRSRSFVLHSSPFVCAEHHCGANRRVVRAVLFKARRRFVGL